MKKITLIILFLSLGAYCVQAKDKSPESVKELTSMEDNFRNAIWYNSRNRAGLSFSPMLEYHTVDLRYDMQKGIFRSPEKASAGHDISLNTKGAVSLGKFWLSGDFSFRNKFEKGACYNTLLYELKEDMPYYISDNYVSGWIKQEYDLNASLTSPVVADIISFSLLADYLTNVGAKQKDPRGETYKYHIQLTPAIVIRTSQKNFIGISGFFEHNFERSVPSLNNYMESPKIIYNKGLGEGIIGKVGGNDGLKTVFYKGLKYGGGLQYAYEDKVSLLLDLNYTFRKTEGFEYPNLPKRLGSTHSHDISARMQLLFGEHKSDRFVLSGFYSITNGIEHIQRLNDEAFNQHWETLSSNTMTYFYRGFASLEYDHLFGSSDKRGHDWSLGGSVRFADRNYSYTVPPTSFTATSTLFDVNGGKNFKFRKSSLLLTLNCGYNLTLGGEYHYGGTKKDSWQVEYYTRQNRFLTTDFIMTGIRAAYSVKVGKTNLFVNAEADWNKPFISSEGDRLACTASFGIIF